MKSKLTINRILFATDFLQSSRLALDYAVAVAHHFQATIIMLHVVQLSAPAMEAELLLESPCVTRKEAQERLDAFASGVRRTGLNVQTHVDDGPPAEMILKAVSFYEADLLVLGVHGMHRGLAHLLIGSNTEKILLSAGCPVMTVGAHVLAGIDLKLQPKEILYVSDFTQQAALAAPYALLFAEYFQVPVDVCQLMPETAEGNPDLQHKIVDEYCGMLGRVISEPLYSKWCSRAFHLEHGREINQIVERASSQLAGLIVMGVHIESTLSRHRHTSFAYQLLAKAACPVFTIRQTLPSIDTPAF